MLKVGYHAACLILAVRCLEETGSGLRSQIFLSDYNGNTTTDSASDDGNDGEPSGSQGDPNNNQETSLRTNICKYAMLTLQTFLDTPQFLSVAVPTCICLCIGYCAFVLAQYDESQSKVSDSKALDFIMRINEWSKTTPGKLWSLRYGELARRKIEARLNGRSRVSVPANQAPLGPQQTGPRQGYRSPGKATSVTPGDRPASNMAPPMYNSDEYPAPQQPAPAPVLPPGFDMADQAMFPSMEDFFGGGFLEWTR